MKLRDITGKQDPNNFDDLNYWNVRKPVRNPTLENLDEFVEEQSLALSVNLLSKDRTISSANLVRLPSHLVTSDNCRCTRSFHLFCTALFPRRDRSLEMIYIHPAPRHHDRESTHRVLSSVRKSRAKYQEFDSLVTTRSEPLQAIPPDSQQFEKKLRVTAKIPPRTTSLNIPSNYNSSQRSTQTSMRSSASVRLAKPLLPPPPPPPAAQLHIRALSVFDQSPFASQIFLPRGPPPSPKTPTQESSMIFAHSIMTPPFRAMGIRPRHRHIYESERKSVHTPTVKSNNYEDHAREYLSASDCSDDEKQKGNEPNEDTNEDEENEDKDLEEFFKVTKPKLPNRNPPLSRPGTSLRDRLITTNGNRSRRPRRSQTRLGTSTNENEDAATMISKTTGTTKTIPIPQSKSSFGFSKTASSMHFGHAAGRLGLHASFERWSQPLSRRTPIGRKQEVTTLRLVTLPLVTS